VLWITLNVNEYHIYLLLISHNISLKLHIELLILTTVNDQLFTCKTDLMKFAIPTNDGISVAYDFESAKGCLIITLVLGDIVHEDIRWKSDVEGAELNRLCSAVSDCSLLLARSISTSSIKALQDKNITVIKTTDEIITNAIVHYMEHEYREAANTCCCP
jgi:predicted Fe-Mo cluster-binding NifX family protein